MKYAMDSQRTLAGRMIVALGLILVVGCAKDRDLKPVIPNTARVNKTALTGNYLYLRTITDVQSPGKDSEWIATGMYMESDKLVQFNLKEKVVEVVALDPQFQNAREARTNAVLASFKARYVDVLRKQNVDGQDTHEEEETEIRNVWSSRGQVVIDVTEDSVDTFKDSTIVANAASGIEIDQVNGAINFSVTRRLKDDTLVTVRHSFVKYDGNTNYAPKEYARDLQRRFGFFMTTTLEMDKYGRITTQTRKEIANRWDATKPVTYYLSKNFPEILKPRAFEIFADWNESLKKAVGHDVLSLKDNSGQELGDLRYSMITFDDNETALHKILGYGPSYTNPRTGEVVKADVILYGGSLKRSLYSERVWENLLAQAAPAPAPGAPVQAGFQGLLKRLLPGKKAPAPAPTPTPQNSDEWLSEMFLPFVQGLDSQLPSGQLPELAIPEVSERLDRDMLAMVKEFSPDKAIREAKTAFHKDYMNRITRLTEDTEFLLNETKHAAGKSDDELTVQIFTPLLTHELGHTLGLRHNFEGSADVKHFTKARGASANVKSSSVMDYGFLTSQEPPGVGSYDDAAIQVLYGSDEANTQKILSQNYFFCTDEHIMDARNGLCNQFDSGSSLTELVQGQMDRYDASFVFNNIKGDKVTFGSSQDYMGKISRYLIPVRLAFDNAQAILTAAQGTNPGSFWYVAGQRVEADADTKAENLLKIKVADSYNVALSPGKWELQPHTVERTIDKAKIDAIVKDAQAAQIAAVKAFLKIILDTTHPIYSSGDLIHDELQIRGTLTDKMVAMMYLFNRTPDPSGNGTVITPFRDLKNGPGPTFLNFMLSNTTGVMDPTTKKITTRLSQYDINLRQMALNLLWTQLAVPGSTAGARNMLASEKVVIDQAVAARKSALLSALDAIPDVKKMLEAQTAESTEKLAKNKLLMAGLFALMPVAPFDNLETFKNIPDELAVEEAQKALAQVNDAGAKATAELAKLDASSSKDQMTYEMIEEYRTQIRARWRTLFNGGADEATQKRLVAEIANIETERNKIPYAFVNTIGDTFIKAPLNLELQSYGTATGRLIRDNLNRAEDQRQASLELMSAIAAQARVELAKPEAQQDKAALGKLAQQSQAMQKSAESISEYIASEKMFVESMYHMYTGVNP